MSEEVLPRQERAVVAAPLAPHGLALPDTATCVSSVNLNSRRPVSALPKAVLKNPVASRFSFTSVSLTVRIAFFMGTYPRRGMRTTPRKGYTSLEEVLQQDEGAVVAAPLAPHGVGGAVDQIE